MIAGPAEKSSVAELKGRRVLVLEDEYFLADELRVALEGCGAVVLGPARGLQDARGMVDPVPPDCAVLDMNLAGDMVFEFADELMACGVPFVFATGYDRPMIPDRFDGIPRFEKPIDTGELVRAVARRCTAAP